MPSSWFFSNLISASLLLLLAAVAGFLIARTHPRLAWTLLVGSLALLWLFSTPSFARHALRLLESSVKAVDTHAQSADAIVILSGGPPVRPAYGAKLQRETGKPILVTGGNPLGNGFDEAQQMKSVLEREFKVPVRWTEDASTNTLENARYSYRLLQAAGIKRIYLVTHAWHMRRSAMAFESAGFEVIPAPAAFTTDAKTKLLDFLPGADALGDSWIVMHELIGLLWYRLKTEMQITSRN